MTGICPNCGEEAELKRHEEQTLDAEGERWYETWFECSHCGEPCAEEEIGQ